MLVFHLGIFLNVYLALKESTVTTGVSLFDLFELVMDREGLDWKNKLVGQSYDSASNMNGPTSKN